jgi:hypothetical protein
LLEILDQFADWLGLRAHTSLSLVPQSKNSDEGKWIVFTTPAQSLSRKNITF